MDSERKSSKSREGGRRLKRPLVEGPDSTQSGEMLDPDVSITKSQNSSFGDLFNLNDTNLDTEASPKGYSQLQDDFLDMCTPSRVSVDKSSNSSQSDQYISLLTSLNKSPSIIPEFDTNTEDIDNPLFTPNRDSQATPKNESFTPKETKHSLKITRINDFFKLKDTPLSSKFTPTSQKTMTNSYETINSLKYTLTSHKDSENSYKGFGISQNDTQFSQHDVVISQNDTQFSQHDVVFSQNDTQFSQNDTEFSQFESIISQNGTTHSQTESKNLDDDIYFEVDPKCDDSAISNYFSFKKTSLTKENVAKDFGTICDILSLKNGSDVNSDKTVIAESNDPKTQTYLSDETDSSSSSSDYVIERRQTRSQSNKILQQNSQTSVMDYTKSLSQNNNEESVNPPIVNLETKTTKLDDKISNSETKPTSLDTKINKSEDKITNFAHEKEKVLRLGNKDDILHNKYGIKYEPVDMDVRRKYKSFEQLCFGLGCLVCPTKQELEMCKQLSSLPDASALSQYETSVYQGCILRSRAFETIWRKFCNRVIGIVRRYILKGIENLLKIIESQELIDPFLKLVLIDLGTDRRDQQLFLNILLEELNNLIKQKYILIRVNNNNNLNDIIKQMYIQLYTQLLLANKNLNVSTTNNNNILNKLIHLYNSFINKFNTNNTNGSVECCGYEFVIVVDKLNEYINDILYLFQMIKRRKLLPINCIVVISTNNEYLEKYCNTRIYSNLGIFECGVITVSSIIEEILQVLMFDVYVQDFIPNFQILQDLYDQYINIDNSFTLFILRVYQMYEQYYNSFIFSYLSILPTHFFKFTNSEDYYTDILLDSEISSDPKTDINMVQGSQMNLDKNLNPYTNAKDKLLNNDILVNTGNNKLLNNNILVNNGTKLLNNNKLVNNGSNVTANNKLVKNNKMNESKTISNEMECVVEICNTETSDNEIDVVVQKKPAPKPSENKLESCESEVYSENGVNILELLDVKNLYSVYSLLCLSNNMSENSVAYFDVKLGLSMPLEKITLEYLPLNTLILLQRRILFQLGVHLLFKSLDFIPEFYTFKSKILKLTKDFDDYKDLINKLVKHITTLCSETNSFYSKSILKLKRLFTNFNKYYSRYKNLLIKIEIFLNNNNLKGIKPKLDDLNRTIRVSNNYDCTNMINDFKDKLMLCLLPQLSTFPLTKILLVQKYSQIITSNICNNNPPISSTSSGSVVGNVGLGGLDVILHINKYIKYKIINMWKLFIIYYFILTGTSSDKKTDSQNPDDIIEIYIKFNNNIEILEKIYKIVAVNNTNSSERLSHKSQQYDSCDRDPTSSVDRMEKINAAEKVEKALTSVGSINIDVYKSIKKSLVNITVKFL
ncbi:uncharacterized protein TA04125 [Theileria annulata]|uniref:Uncharacterized protein n=1 Tax=Theileria annulata TaxID=5874 RepID=Q4UC79_THEAN|nr:uncharacterized protein TA04125 [Theileria annulata]CAI75572.1 hypothetical protein, conserved [Theileria annulata]|eukprot:XP_955048.1 hypothetical protein, conserved [Theileria annulata]